MGLSHKRKNEGWSDPFHRTLRQRVKLGEKYFDKLALPHRVSKEDALTPVKVGLRGPNSEGFEDATTRPFNDLLAPPSTILDPSLSFSQFGSMLGNDNLDNFGSDEQTIPATSSDAVAFETADWAQENMQEDFGTWTPWTHGQGLAYDEGLEELESFHKSDSTHGSDDPFFERQSSTDGAEPMAPVAPKNGLPSFSPNANDAAVKGGGGIVDATTNDTINNGVDLVNNDVIHPSVEPQHPTTSIQVGVAATPPPTPTVSHAALQDQVVDINVAADALPVAATVTFTLALRPGNGSNTMSGGGRTSTTTTTPTTTTTASNGEREYLSPVSDDETGPERSSR
ncbi:hypothetical protein B0T20DRAFT_392448 [Sordaria brevicollis]|uniref:Uncharacterized protein n=1 Tax=Sordaria brevicollis TaxID=83679 RepID=A0AAE0UD62_SORBR|nr:hypothetical protein B0T20DRAFT_392448 [Sordaria brevicollis]